MECMLYFVSIPTGKAKNRIVYLLNFFSFHSTLSQIFKKLWRLRLDFLKISTFKVKNLALVAQLSLSYDFKREISRNLALEAQGSFSLDVIKVSRNVNDP